MATIASLPVIDVYIAFNPTEGGATLNNANIQALPASGASNSYWTNCSEYVRDFDTNTGKQHFLDRVEAGTLEMTVNGRDGFFMNGTINGSGYVGASRQPIAVTGTWMGTTYPLFWGITDSIQEQPEDYLNVDFVINASDLLKQLSLKYMSSSNFWPTYAKSTSAANWYRCDATNTAIITAASGNGTTVTYTAFNNFSAGDNITVSGLTTASGTSLNLVNVVIATVTSTGFTVTNSANGISSGTGSAYRTAILDQIGSNNGYYIGTVSFPTYGAMIYDIDTCVDTGSGSATNPGYIRLPDFAGTQGAIDFWVLGQGIANSVFTIVQSTGAAQIELICSATGVLEANVLTVGVVSSGIKIDDGYWHHIGFCDDASGNLTLYVDGTFHTGGAFSGLSGWESVTGQNTVIPAVIGAAAPSAYYDEIIVSTASHLSGLQNELKSRYRAGSLLQLPTNPTQSSVLSGDRIAEILCIAGFGVITNGAIVLNANTYFINDGSAWVNGTSGNGFIDVEPWYWDTPVTGSSALDLIGEITDTDIGVFFQKPDGTLNFYNQNYYGQWGNITAMSSTSSTLTFTMANTLSPGDTVNVTGALPGTVSAYNGTWTVATASSTQFTVTSSVNPGAGTSAYAWGTVGCWVPNSYSPAADHIWTDDDSGYAYLGKTLQVMRDDTDTWTQVQVTPQAGIEQIYEAGSAAEERWGFACLIKSDTVHPTLNLALSTANFLGYLFRSPLPRVQRVDLSSETSNGAQMTAILGANNGNVVEFKRTSPNASTSGTYPDEMGQIDQLMVIESKKLSYKGEDGILTMTTILDPYPVRA